MWEQEAGRVLGVLLELPVHILHQSPKLPRTNCPAGMRLGKLSWIPKNQGQTILAGSNIFPALRRPPPSILTLLYGSRTFATQGQPFLKTQFPFSLPTSSLAEPLKGSMLSPQPLPFLHSVSSTFAPHRVPVSQGFRLSSSEDLQAPPS